MLLPVTAANRHLSAKAIITFTELLILCKATACSIQQSPREGDRPLSAFHIMSINAQSLPEPSGLVNLTGNTLQYLSPALSLCALCSYYSSQTARYWVLTTVFIIHSICRRTGEKRRLKDLWQQRVDEQPDLAGSINMRLESIAAGRREVCEKQLENDRYTATERLSPIDKLSLCSGKPAINGGALQDPRNTHTTWRNVCECERERRCAVCRRKVFEMQSTSWVLGSSFRC